ncbi:MAG: SEL1-like repeat protein [Methylocystaceae bacterium]|nr:SEL1-like repeat protein [Methylocystaceae bacterium]
MKPLTRTLPIIMVATASSILFSSQAVALTDTDCTNIPKLETNANQGIFQSSFDLGTCFETGTNVEKSRETAFQHFKKAADGKLPAAMLRTGVYYLYGSGGVKKDQKLAANWISKAAETGLAEAEAMYGELHFRGWGVRKNIDEGMKWLNKAIEKNNTKALNFLAGEYFYGRNLSKDREKALSLYLKAAENGGIIQAGPSIINIYRNGEGAPKSRELADQWTLKYANHADPRRINQIAERYLNAKGRPRDGRMAISLYKISAEKGDQTAKYHLMNLYFVGFGVERNLSKARKWATVLANDPEKYGYHKPARKILNEIDAEERGEETQSMKSAKLLKSLTRKTPPLKLKIEADCSNVKLTENKAKKGDIKSLIDLSVCYTNGDGVAQSYETGFNHAKQAAKAGSPMGNYIVGVYYNLGSFVKKDHNEAAKWYLKAANDGLANAQHMMGIFHTAGTGVPKNMATAGQWFKKAIDQKYTPSLMYLGRQLGGPFTKNKKALETSFLYYAKAFEYGDMKALYPLSQMLKDGKGVPKDEKRAFELAELYLDTGSSSAYRNISEYYLKGIGTQKDVNQAISLLEKAADMNDELAMLKLMNLYYKGNDVSKDVKTARKWAEQLSAKGKDWTKEQADELLKKIKAGK